MYIHHYLFLAFLLLKPFYFFPSGGIQISDLFFIASFILYLLIVKKGDKITIDKADKWLLYFVTLVFGINLIYFLMYGKFGFMISSIYYMYNFLIVVVFRIYADDEGFLMILEKVCKLNIIIQVLIYVLKFGRFYSENRYMGTFNDPNQMAFFIFMSLITAFTISEIRNAKLHIAYHIMAVGLIFLTSSTGMFLGIAVFYTVQVLMKVAKVINHDYNVKVLLFIIASLIMGLLFSAKIDDYITTFSQSSIIVRVEQKLDKSSDNNGGSTNIQERGIDKLILYPEKTIFGAGEGYYARFDKAYTDLEVHSTALSIFFYYGIVPTMLFLIWCYKNIRILSVSNVAVILALFVESLTLLNQRQPLFWMIFVILNILANKKMADNQALSSEEMTNTAISPADYFQKT